jgi:hypothetical protein
MRVIVAVLAGLCLAAAGCGKPAPPPFTEVEGVVLLDGSPLGKAQVDFIPELADYGAEMNSSAVTEDDGHFVLIRAKDGQPGAAVASHRVVVTEGPLPDRFRGMSGDAQTGAANYLRSLKNRPIPEQYGTMGKTPLHIEVKADQKRYEIKLTRQ